MKRLWVVKGLILSLFTFFTLQVSAADFHKLSAKDLGDKDVDFSKYKGKVVLVVNTASRCGYTPQLKGMQALHEKYSKKGLQVVGFPSNDFNQEDMDGKKLKKFCLLNYGVAFQMFKKVHVNGKERHPVYKYLVQNSSNSKEDVSWNFEKFLVGKNGKVLARYKSKVSPESPELIKAIEKAL